MNAGLAEHPFNWLARKQHRTHFIHGSATSSPSNNSELLYDGSAEARAMLDIDPDMESVPSGIRRHALDYLKGKDPVNPGMWTRDFWGEEFVEELTAEELTAEDKNMTMQELEPEPQKTELEQIAQAFLLMKLPVTIVKV